MYITLRNYLCYMWILLIVLSTQYGCSDQKSKALSALISETHTSNIKILIIGIDGATLSVITPLIKDGKLPQFQKLMEEGAYGIMKSQKPMFSPALWTSFITGKDRKIHGIELFTMPRNSNSKQEGAMVNSNDRRSLALWNILGPFGKTVGFIGWWASWPAEKVNGWIISDWLIRNSISSWYSESNKTQFLTYPSGLIKELIPYIFKPTGPFMNEINKLVKLNKNELTQLKSIQKPIYAEGLSLLKFIYCVQRSIEEMLLYMLKKGQPDLMGVYLEAVDPISHTFWHYYEPEKFPAGIDAEKITRFSHLIPNIYIHDEQYIKKLLEKVDPNTVVFIISDHGFKSSGVLPQMKSVTKSPNQDSNNQSKKPDAVAIGLSGDHHIDGIFIAYGKPIKKVSKITVQIFDIFPTILALMGLPIPDDIQGRVLKEIIDETFLEKYPIKTIGSYENYIKRQRVSLSSKIESKESIDMLRALGYVK